MTGHKALKQDKSEEGLAPGIAVVAFLAMLAPPLATLPLAWYQDSRMQTILSGIEHGNINVTITDGKHGQRVDFRQPDEESLKKIKNIVREGEYSTGDRNFPKYPHSLIEIRDANGNLMCQTSLESRDLLKLIKLDSARVEKIKSAESIEDIAEICKISPNEVKSKYFNLGLIERSFQPYTLTSQGKILGRIENGHQATQQNVRMFS